MLKRVARPERKKDGAASIRRYDGYGLEPGIETEAEEEEHPECHAHSSYHLDLETPNPSLKNPENENGRYTKNLGHGAE
jgi:hypothetical protein